VPANTPIRAGTTHRLVRIAKGLGIAVGIVGIASAVLFITGSIAAGVRREVPGREIASALTSVTRVEGTKRRGTSRLPGLMVVYSAGDADWRAR
jgi:hypothetical protein